jgi:N-acetylglucosaminyldiphosphoundecaprenol N-acetyl-beta-D-mannosaminyltransferase
MTEAEVIARLMSDLQQGRGGCVATLNIDVVRMLHQRPELWEVWDDKTLILADGMPLVWASRVQGTPLPARVAGSSLIFSLSGAAARNRARVLLLGGSPTVAEEAAAVLTRKNAGLQVAGIICPPFGFDQDPAGMASLREAVVRTKPDIVYACFGFPKQEYVIRYLRETLPATWFLGLGASFNFVSGEVRRAPVWMQRVGLEWSWRLMMEPRRLFKRYIVHDLPFAVQLMLSAIRNRRRHGHETLRQGEPIRFIRPSLTEKLE